MGSFISYLLEKTCLAPYSDTPMHQNYLQTDVFADFWILHTFSIMLITILDRLFKITWLYQTFQITFKSFNQISWLVT